MIEQVEPILDVSGLKTVFRTRGGAVHAVNNVSFDLVPGELLGVVGESGSGKSVTMMSLIGLLPQPPAEIVSGTVLLDGVDILKMKDDDLREVRGGRIGFVFQDPMTSLNPVYSVGYQLMEPLRKHMNMSKSKARKRAAELLELVGIPDADARLNDYPHQFSGGQRQRVAIARAIVTDPKIIVADEPTGDLDATGAEEILKLLRELCDRFEKTFIMVTHDPDAATIADRTVYLHKGVLQDTPRTTTRRESGVSTDA